MIDHVIVQKPTRLFLYLGGFFITNALIAEFMGVKLFSLEKTLGLNPVDLHFFGNSFSFNLTAGVLLWPVVFIMTDIINEYYGPKGVRFLSYLTAALIAFAFVMFFGAIHLVPADFWIHSKAESGIPDLNLAYATIFGQGMGIIVASLAAFLLGQVVDVVLFHRIKKWTGEKHIWLRSTGSTLISQLIDSFIVLFIAFYIYPRVTNQPAAAQWSLSLVLAICTGNYIYKLVVAITLTPVIYWVHNAVEKYLGTDLAHKMKEKAILDD
jgi:hypothetical protein